MPRRSETTSKGQKLAQRLSRIVARLHQGASVNKHQLASDFGVDVRTIERDLGERLKGIAERNLEGKWQLTRDARSTIPATHLQSYARMAGTRHLFPDDSLRYVLAQLEIPESSRAIQVQPTPCEDLNGSDAFTRLQHAVENRNPCSFVYKNKQRAVHPHRLIHQSGVWYLAAEEQAQLKNFSVALIQDLRLESHLHFTPDPRHHSYIEQKNDVWFTPNATEVMLRVDAEMAHYFTRKQQFPHQVHRFDADGSLLVNTRINHINQLLPVVRYWLPNVRIVQPVSWHETLVEGLRTALQAWEH